MGRTTISWPMTHGSYDTLVAHEFFETNLDNTHYTPNTQLIQSYHCISPLLCDYTNVLTT